MNLFRTTLIAVAFMAVAVVAAAAAPTPSADGDPQKRITVSGSGRVESVPDRGTFSFGVQSEAKTARGALALNAAETRRMIAALKAAGISPVDIRTEYVSVYPRTDGDGRTILGYAAHNSVSATIRDLDRAGAVIDAAVEAGANQISGPALTRSDRAALYRDALRAAVANARAKAEALAAAAGGSLGGALEVVEGGSTPPQPMPMAARDEVAASTPIEPGTEAIEASVTVTFVLN